MKLSEFVGYGDRMVQLMRSVQAGRIVHALLFEGPPGSGKRTMARLFAQALLCRGNGEKPCGVCPACRRVLAGSHPDVRVVRSDEKRKYVGIDAIRDLIEYLSMRPYEGGRHVAIIEQADRMSTQAQNALLKTLENPSGDSMLILIADGSGALLPTILSRCQTVRFTDLSPEDCAGVLVRRGMATERARVLAGMAQGSVGRALEMDADTGFMDLRAKVLTSLESLKDAASVATAASMLEEDRSAAERILDIMELWARDRMAVQAGARPFQAGDYDRLARFGIDGVSLLKGVTRARAQLASNVGWPGVLENMYFHLINMEICGRTSLSWQR